MAKNDTNKDEALAIERLERLEAIIREHDVLLNRAKMIQLGGIGLIFLFFTIFIFRLYSYVKDYEVEGLADTLISESYSTVQPDLDIFLRELKGDLLPAFSKQLMDEFQASMPVIKKSAIDLSADLEQKFKARAEERLLETMIRSLENSEDDIKQIFPEFTPEDLERQIGQSMGYYIDKLHDAIEERISLVSTSLIDLKDTARSIGQAEDFAELRPTSVSQAEDQLLNALLDLVIYEIKPILGDEPVN